MKATKKGKKYIKEVIKHWSLGGRYFYGGKNKRYFTLKDLKSFGPKNILNFLEVYYRISHKAYYKVNKVDIQSWLGTLKRFNVEMVLLSNQEIQTILFPLIMSDEYTERAASVIESHRKIIKAINGITISYKKNSLQYMKQFKDTKNKLVSSGNWAWSKKKEV